MIKTPSIRLRTQLKPLYGMIGFAHVVEALEQLLFSIKNGTEIAELDSMMALLDRTASSAILELQSRTTS